MVDSTLMYNNSLSFLFAVRLGVRHGGVLSPAIFTLFVNAFIVNLRELSIGCHIKSTFIGCLLCADDIILVHLFMVYSVCWMLAVTQPTP
jgi:hypothetical protein